MLPLLPAERTLEQKRVHSHNQIHRRTDLMAHTRKEIALRTVCRFRGLLSEFQLLLVAHAFSDVDDGAKGQFAGGALNPVEVHLKGYFNPVFSQTAKVAARHR